MTLKMLITQTTYFFLLEKYTIKELENLTGIKAHTIRTWEKRYGLLSPSRNQANVRSYIKQDLELLKCIAVLKNDGVKISHIAGMTKEEIDHQMVCCCQRKLVKCDHPDILTNAIVDMKPNLFRSWVEEKINQLGLVSAVLTELFPLKNKVNLLKLTGEINNVQEKFVEQIIVRSLASHIYQVEKTNRQKKEAVLYIPQGPSFEPCLLFAHYLLASNHYNVINVGKVERISEIGQLVSKRNPALIMTFLSEQFCKCSVKEYIHTLSQIGQSAQVLIGGYQTKHIDFKTPSNIHILKNLKEIINTIPAFH